MISHAGHHRRAVNYLKAIQFEGPEWTPCVVSLMPGTWMKHREALEEIVLAHPKIFPGFKRGSQDFDRCDDPLYLPGRRSDCWGTVWENIEKGLSSLTVKYPLEDWEALADYVPPDPLKDDAFGPRDWASVERRLAQTRRNGGLATGFGLPHGFMYMRLYYLRGFENLMMDMASGEPRLEALIAMVENYNCAVIRRCLELGAEMIALGEDLGLQRSLPISPAMWRRYIKPSYERMFRPCREGGTPIRLHTDGHILEIIPDLIETGVRVLNPQIRANGLDGLRETAKGKVAIDLDLDRQLFPFATPSQIEEHIGEVFEALHAPEGGLLLYAECEPDVPLENIEAICRTLERIGRLPEPEKTG